MYPRVVLPRRSALAQRMAQEAFNEMVRKAKSEGEQKAKQEAELKAKTVMEQKAKQEAELKAKAETEQKATYEAALKAKAKTEQKADKVDETIDLVEVKDEQDELLNEAIEEANICRVQRDVRSEDYERAKHEARRLGRKLDRAQARLSHAEDKIKRIRQETGA